MGVDVSEISVRVVGKKGAQKGGGDNLKKKQRLNTFANLTPMHETP
jgi:hypothetical protein